MYGHDNRRAPKCPHCGARTSVLRTHFLVRTAPGLRRALASGFAFDAGMLTSPYPRVTTRTVLCLEAVACLSCWEAAAAAVKTCTSGEQKEGPYCWGARLPVPALQRVERQVVEQFVSFIEERESRAAFRRWPGKPASLQAPLRCRRCRRDVRPMPIRYGLLRIPDHHAPAYSGGGCVLFDDSPNVACPRCRRPLG